MKTLVWLHGDSLSNQDPAALKYPAADRVFVFDRLFLGKAQLSFKRLFFLYECAAEAAQEIRLGEIVEELREAVRERRAERLAVTGADEDFVSGALLGRGVFWPVSRRCRDS